VSGKKEIACQAIGKESEGPTKEGKGETLSGKREERLKAICTRGNARQLGRLPSSTSGKKNLGNKKKSSNKRSRKKKKGEKNIDLHVKVSVKRKGRRRRWNRKKEIECSTKGGRKD